MGKTKSRTPNQSYDPTRTLRPAKLDPSLEACARDLYEKACCGSRRYWSEIIPHSSFKQNDQLRKDFLAAAHEGMRAAQSYIIDQVQSKQSLSPSEELIYRGVADSIAWQFLGNQLCHARRLFKEHHQPDLKQSNFASVVAVANSISRKDRDAMPLISDLTSFVQVGDILSMTPETGLSIFEVKEGTVNKKISDFLEFHSQSGCDRALQNFLTSEGPQVAKQMGRMIRQTERMGHVVEVMETGTGTDPDTDQKIIIPKDSISVEEWDADLNNIIEKSDDNGWALDVVDGCLFVACYSSGPLLPVSHLMFNMWFDQYGADPNSPRARLIESMKMPLALPVFARQIPEEAKFDILFGRKHICMGINVQALLDRCVTIGLTVRHGTNKETSKLQQLGARPFQYKGKSIFIGNGEREMVFMDGIFLRALFHGQRPVSIIHTLLSIDDSTSHLPTGFGMPPARA